MSSRQCPHCAAPFSPAEIQEGRRSACGRELLSFQAPPARPDGSPGDRAESPSAQPYPPSGEFQPEEKRTWRPLDDQAQKLRTAAGWQGVRAGLGLLNVGTIVSLVCQVLGGVPILIGHLSPQLNASAEVLALFVLVANGVALLILLVGMVRSALAPADSGLRGLGLAALLCNFTAILLLIAGIVAVFLLVDPLLAGVQIEPGIILAALAVLLGGLLAFVSTLLFAMYLRGVACHFGNTTLGNTFIGYFILSTVLLFLFVAGLTVLAATDPRRAQDMGTNLVAWGVTTVTGTVLMIWLVAMLNQLRKLMELPR